MWINNRVRLKCGYRYGNNQKLMYNQGIYVLGNPSILSTPSQKEVTLQLLDKYVLIDGTVSGKLKNKHIISIGTRIDTAIKSIIVDLIGETKYIVDQCTVTTPYTITKEINSSVADLLNELCYIAGDYQVAYNNDGYLHFRRVLTVEDINTLPVSYSYTTSGDYIQSTRELKWNDVRNKIVVYGMYDENTGIQYKATAEDITGSEMSIDKIGERVEVLEFQELNSNALCKARADYELLKRIKSQEQVSIQVIPNFSLKLNDVISVTDENNGVSGNYLIQSIPYNFSHDSVMALGSWRIRDIR